MKRYFFCAVVVGLTACGSGERTRGSEAAVPRDYLGTWIHDEPYINESSDRVTRRRLTLQVVNDSTVLENWYGTSVKTSGTETALSSPTQLVCEYIDSDGCLLCGANRWAGADTLCLQADGNLVLRGRAYPQPVLFQKIK